MEHARRLRAGNARHIRPQPTKLRQPHAVVRDPPGASTLSFSAGGFSSPNQQSTINNLQSSIFNLSKSPASPQPLHPLRHPNPIHLRRQVAPAQPDRFIRLVGVVAHCLDDVTGRVATRRAALPGRARSAGRAHFAFFRPGLHFNDNELWIFQPRLAAQCAIQECYLRLRRHLLSLFPTQMNSTHELIAAATKADSELVPVLERIMREDIFHGTLDWQSREELEEAAVQALAIYEADKEFHDADTLFRKARWARILAERDSSQALQPQTLLNTLKAAQEAEETALRDFQSFTLRLAHTV